MSFRRISNPILFHNAITILLAFSFSPTVSAQDNEVRVASRMATSYGKYAVVRLTTDLNKLSSAEKKMIPLLIDAATQMDQVFWMQAYGDKNELLATIKDPDTRRFAEINYGPWDRLDGNEPFIDGVGEKSTGANYYPADMTKQEFETHLQAKPGVADAFKSLYTIIRRDDQRGLYSIPYHEAYPNQCRRAAKLLEQSAEYAEDDSLKNYLLARAKALLSDEYQESDLLWMDMKTNRIDCVIGPIETYEDQLFGYKAAHECYVLVKDMDWSARLSEYASLLPELQKGLPVEPQYKQEEPGLNSDLNAYDVIYYAGDCNAGSKTIAINLPNDEEVQLKKGSRRLQLKNAMRAKFDRILVPIGDLLIAEDQRKHVTFNAFFSNTMFHEVAHGLGIKNTINGKGRVRESLRDLAGTLEEGKADILGLYMVTQLFESGGLKEGELMDYYVTFMSSIFRSIRFGTSSAHGRANTLRFNFFKEHDAFTRDDAGKYRVNFENMKTAMTLLGQKILKIQGDGDYLAATQFMDEMGTVQETLQADLERVNRAGIPVDVVFEQGPSVLGLN
jgi:hypothetical protein